jgi:ribosomal protein L20
MRVKGGFTNRRRHKKVMKRAKGMQQRWLIARSRTPTNIAR